MAFKTAVMYSGGLDSFCIDHVFKPEVRVFVDTGTDNAKSDAAMLKLQAEKADKDITVFDMKMLRAFELENGIIPYRNLLFAVIGASFAPQVYMGSTADDDIPDNSVQFAQDTSALLSFLNSDDRAGAYEADAVYIRQPWKALSKLEIVQTYEKHGGDVNKLFELTRSCNVKAKHECGVCLQCYRKATLMKRLGVYRRDVFKHDPFKLPVEQQVSYFNLMKKESEDYADFDPRRTSR